MISPLQERKPAMAKMGVRILEATVGLRSADARLLPRLPEPIDVPSLRTDFRVVEEIPFLPGLDGEIVLRPDTGSALTFSLAGRRAVFHGPLVRAERQASDIRFGLWGNQGFLYRFALRLLEECHGIFSFHAVGLYEESRHTLYIVAGGAGSGKTVYLLGGLARGLALFSTETVHFRRTRKGLTWFKGSLVDNIRLGTLVCDFPAFLPAGSATGAGRDLWQNKIALDLAARQTPADVLVSPRIVLLFPRIEAGRPGFVRTPLRDTRTAAKAVFDNVSQKIAETVVLWDRLAVTGLDSAALAKARWTAALELVRHASLAGTSSVLSNPQDCWGDLLDG